jgi:signal transduction histidine kinase
MRRRIVGLVFALTAAALLLLSIPLALEARSRIRSDERSKLARFAAITASDISVEGTVGRDPIELPAVSRGAPLLAVYSAEGVRLEGNGPDRLDATLTPPQPGQVREISTASELVVAVPIAVDEQVRVVVRAAQSNTIVNRAFRTSLLRIGSAALLALGAATGAALALSNRLLRPLRMLHTMAQGIGNTDMKPSPVSGVAELDAIGHALHVSASRVTTSLIRERAFSADVSHQLRTPLTGLRLSLENEIEHPRSDHNAALKDALRDVDRLEATVESLLSLAREGGGQATTSDCRPMIADRVTQASRLFDAQHRLIRFDEAGPIVAQATLSAVAEIIDVLLSNALHHANGTVRVEIERSEAHVVIAVDDDGPGLAQPDAAFRRRDPSAAGSGIGLALGRRLAQAEGGDLVVARYQPSCRFELILPNGNHERN